MTNSARILVLGARGLVGRFVVEAAQKQGTLALAAPHAGEGALDVRDTDGVLEAATAHRATHIVIGAARPNIESCETDPVHTGVINVDAPLSLARRCAGRFTLVAFSFEYVFDGEATQPYDEDAQTAPRNEHGRQKMRLERALLADPAGGHLIVRTSGVYGDEPARKNFVLSLWDRLRATSETIDVAYDQLVTPTLAPSLGALVVEACEKRVAGVLHLAGSEVLARDVFARLAARAAGFPDSRIRGVATEAMGLRARRPHRAALSTAKATSLLQTPLMAPLEGLRALAEHDA